MEQRDRAVIAAWLDSCGVGRDDEWEEFDAVGQVVLSSRSVADSLDAVDAALAGLIGGV